MADKEVSGKPFVGTPEHQTLAKADTTVITPTATNKEVGEVLRSSEFEKTLSSYCGA